MSENLTLQLATQQFTTNLQMRLQQIDSKLRGRVMEGAHQGEAAAPVQYVAPFVMDTAAGVNAPVPRADATFQRRWVMPESFEQSVRVDSFMRKQTIVDPTAIYAQEFGAAINRMYDDVIIQAANGTANTGVRVGSFTTETFAQAGTASPAGSNKIADTFGNGSTIGCTVEKLIEARRLLMKNHVDLDNDPLTLVIGSQQYADLMKLAQLQNRDFSPAPVLVNGKIPNFLGFDIVVSERLTVASSIRQCFAFARSGIYLGIWEDMYTRVSEETAVSSQPWQLYARVMMGATRLEPGRVIEIDCGNDTSGADNI